MTIPLSISMPSRAFGGGAAKAASARTLSAKNLFGDSKTELESASITMSFWPPGWEEENASMMEFEYERSRSARACESEEKLSTGMGTPREPFISTRLRGLHTQSSWYFKLGARQSWRDCKKWGAQCARRHRLVQVRPDPDCNMSLGDGVRLDTREASPAPRASHIYKRTCSVTHGPL